MRRTWMKRRPPRRIARETEAESFHKCAIRAMGVCAVAKYTARGACSGPLQAAHLGPSGGMSAKHGDWTHATMMCARHHRAHDRHLWPFSEMSEEELAAFRSHEIHLAREFVAGRRTVSA
jgi:hypothetical protein